MSRLHFDKSGLPDVLKKALSERISRAELDDDLEPEAGSGRPNRSNGRSKKTVLTETPKIALDIPRDRSGILDPQVIAKCQRRFPGSE